MNIKQFVTFFGVSIAFPFEVYSHTVVEDQCENTTIYSFDSEANYNNQPLLIETNSYILKIQNRSEIWDIHELEITSKSNPIKSVQLLFEGPVFEITSLELDNTALGKEFMVTDKPSAQGYRYSLIPSLDGKTITNNSQLSQLWSLPEHDYPMFTDLNNDQVCEVLDFNEKYISYFKHPSFMVSSNAYRYNAQMGQLELTSSLNKQHIQTQWDDELYRFQRLLQAIEKTESKEDISLQTYESEIEAIFATRFLYTAKQVGQFLGAIERLEHLFLAFNKLEAEDNLSYVPFIWSIWGEISFEEFKELNNDIELFSQSELMEIENIFVIINLDK